jgi:surface protein
MYDMFARCENLKELNLSSFEIRENCDTDWMFVDCRRLHMLKLDDCNEDTIRKIIESREFPTGEAEDYEGTRQIFVKAENVGKLTAPDGWEFVNCKTGEIIEGKPVNYEGGMFRDNRDIEKVNVMVTKEHTDLGSMFSECENLKTINGIKDWDTSNVENMNGMFFNCKSLESLDLSSFNTSQVTTMDTMFFNCENLRELNLSNFEIREDCNTDLMFRECRRLHTLRLDNCSRETVEKIINSSDFPIGRAEDYDETRKIYIRSFDSVIQPPDGWVFEYVD